MQLMRKLLFASAIDCRNDTDTDTGTTTISCSRTVTARCSARIAVMVVLPHCRWQVTITYCAFVESNFAWLASGPKLSSCRAKAAESLLLRHFLSHFLANPQ